MFLGRRGETIRYVTKLIYPLWGVPWDSYCVLVDSLGLSPASTYHNTIPDVRGFTEELEQSSRSFDLFREALVGQGQTFKDFVLPQKKEPLGHIVSNESVVISLSEEVKVAVESQKDCPFLIPLKISLEDAKSDVVHLVEKKRGIDIDISALQFALENLEEKTTYHKEKMSREIDIIWKDYDERIMEMKKQIETIQKGLLKEKENDTKKAMKTCNTQLNRIDKEILRFEKALKRKSYQLEENLERRKESRHRYPKRSKRILDHRIESGKEQITELKEQIRDQQNEKRAMLTKKEKIIQNIEMRFQTNLAREIEKMTLLQESRTFEIDKKREIISEIESFSDSIGNQIERLILGKNQEISSIEKSLLHFKTDDAIILGISFYGVKYETQGKSRIDIYPPVLATSYEGAIRKIRRTLLSFNLGARLQLLLKPRLTALNETVLDRLRQVLESDSSTMREIDRIGESQNLLRKEQFIEEASEGMRDLLDEGWIKTQEQREILNYYG